MKVIVDASIWSLALRRRKESKDGYVELFKELIADGRVAIIRAIRQEILSGIRHQEQYAKIKNQLRAFPDLRLEVEHVGRNSGVYCAARQSS